MISSATRRRLPRHPTRPGIRREADQALAADVGCLRHDLASPAARRWRTG
jgi:hypothetical protein